eukprot:Tamp_30661.p5 GENE.Tamp_30661~~Tamp_30661.p5  ORF type:complete len:137 (-),score=11.41 Tamp_30661:103-513(-)
MPCVRAVRACGNWRVRHAARGACGKCKCASRCCYACVHSCIHVCMCVHARTHVRTHARKTRMEAYGDQGQAATAREERQRQAAPANPPHSPYSPHSLALQIPGKTPPQAQAAQMHRTCTTVRTGCSMYAPQRATYI